MGCFIDKIGIVIIGRNEGQRLINCLNSVHLSGCQVVYVDSGSSDGSPDVAKLSGARCIELDASQPYSAARARNAGFTALGAGGFAPRYVQFIDGDCELVPEWLNQAFIFLERHHDVAAVCGRRSERFPHKSVYNWLCDVEWDTPIGEALACGGDSLMRADAFKAVGGFRDNLVAGEEPELCARFRRSGWRIWRIAAAMTQHDAAMTNFRQWWRRAVRSGQSEAEICWNFTTPGDWTSEKTNVMRSIFWGGGLPLASGVGALVHPAAILGLGLYPLQICKIAFRSKQNSKKAWMYALFMVLIKFAQLQGNIMFWLRHVRGRRIDQIHYKK